MARHEVIETARLLGFDLSDEKQVAAFVASIETSLSSASELVDAKVLQGGSKVAWSERNDDVAHSNAKPQLPGSQIGPRLADIQSAYGNLQNAQMQIHSALLEDRARAAKAEAAQSEAKKAVINEVISFWTSATDFYVSGVAASAGIANGGVAASVQAKVGNKLDGGAAVKRQQAAGKAFEEHGGMRNHYDREMARQEASAHYDAKPAKNGSASTAGNESGSSIASNAQLDNGPGGELPSVSPSSVVKFGLELLYRADIRALERKIAAAESKGVGAERAALFAKTQIEMSACAAAGETLRNLLEGLDVQGRQQDYMELGAELDRYAMEHGSALRSQGRADLALKPGQQRHGTTMSILAKIEQYKVLSNLAVNSFKYDDVIGRARTQIQERARMKLPTEASNRSIDQALKPPPPLPAMPQDEQDVYNYIGGKYIGVLKQDEEWRMRLKGVTQNAAGLMKRLTGSASSKSYVGKKY